MGHQVDKDILKRALYFLRKDLSDKTEYAVSKSIDNAYSSVGIEDAFVNLMTFGVLSKTIPSHDSRYFIILDAQECNEIVKAMSKNEKEVIDKIYRVYDKIVKIKKNEIKTNRNKTSLDKVLEKINQDMHKTKPDDENNEELGQE